MLSTRTRVGGTSSAPEGSGRATYEDLFGETPYADVPEELSIFGPGAYFADLMALVERTITERNPGLGELSLRNRRPDLWNMLVDPENATGMISNADLVRDVLESVIHRLGPPAAAFPAAALPAGSPAEFVVTDSWPDSFTAKSTYLIDGGPAPLAVGDTPVAVTTTVRSARWMRTIAIGAAPLTIGEAAGAKAAPEITLEGFSFTFAEGAAAKSLLRCSGGTLTLRNCVFSTSSSRPDGWAIACEDGDGSGGSITIENCTFVDDAPGVQGAPVDTTGAGHLSVQMSDSIVWTVQPPVPGFAVIRPGPKTVARIGHCDIRGGRSGLPDGPHIEYAKTNFDLDPGFAESDPPYTRFRPSSPVVGAGSDGGDVGAALDLRRLIAWGVYPFEFPLDIEAQRARLAIDAAGSSLTEIGEIMAGVPTAGTHGTYFPLSELGLSLADYVTLSTRREAGLEPYYGLASFDDAAIVIGPAPRPGRWAFPAAAFAKRIGLSLDELAALVYQDLDQTEIAAGLQAGDADSASLPEWNGFFVNGYGDETCGTLELLTQPIPVGRFAPEFNPTSPGSIAFPALAQAPEASFTLSLWVLPAGSGAATIFDSGSGESRLRLSLGADSHLEIVAGTRTLTVDVSVFLSAGQWFPVSVVSDHSAATLRCFVNGEAAGEMDAGDFVWPNTPFTLGVDSSDEPFTGSVADLTIWNRALGAAEIADTFLRPAVEQPGTGRPVPEGLLGFWPVNDDDARIRDWSSAEYPSGPGDGTAKNLTFKRVGMPRSALSAGDLPLADGRDFVQTELLTASGGGLSAANLDRVSRFVRLSSRLGWSFADLDWALFVLFSADGSPEDFTDPSVFAGLADIADAADRIGLPLQQVCALMGPLKPFGRGRLGDDPPPFDQIFNAPPPSSPPLTADGTLIYSIEADFKTPGPISRRLASALRTSVEEVTAMARVLASGDVLTLDADTLARFYALRLLADLLGGDTQAALRLIAFAGLRYGRFTPAELRRFLREAAWIEDAGIDPVDLHVLVPPKDPPVPDPYDTEFELEMKDALPALVGRLGQSLNGVRVGPDSFVAPDVDLLRSSEIFEAQVNAGLLGRSGLITSKLWGLLPTAPYVVPSIEYPTIADAVEAAATALNAGSTDLATVLISPGTYDKPGSFGISVGLTKGTLAIEARQANGATVIDCKDSPFITIEQRGTGQAVISGLTIQNGDSTTLNGGGAITSSCALSLIGCRFFGNKARGDGSGGAVGVSGGADTIPLNVEGCLFYANSGVGGGALALVAARATVGRSTFYGNSLPSGAGNGFLLDAASSLELNGSIAWDVTAQPSTEWRGGGSVVFTYSDLHCDPPADGGDPGGEGCVYTDPLLVAPERHLFQPGPGSPCIGTGPDGQNMGYGSAAAIGGSMGLALFPYAYAQIEVLRHALTDFFEDDRLPLATVLDLIGRDENGLEILSPGGDPGAQTKYLRRLYRYLLLAYRFRLDAHLLNLVLTEPALFSLNTDASPFEPRRDDIHMLAGFTGLRDAFPDASAELVAYLRSSAAGTAVKPPAAALAAMFGWSEDAIKALLGDRVPLRLGPVIAIARAVELGERTGFDATLLNSLATDGLVFGSAGATPLLNAVAAVDEDLATGVEAIVTGLEREALKLFAIPLIDAASRPAGFPVTTDDELSDYLLMDVDMGVQTTSSRLVSATQSLQQYVERSRLGFEPRVFDVALSEKEWDWFGGYRTWQANRKVFVHPEDYVRPELRRDKTAIFRDLERSIANAPPTGEGLEHLVRKYLDQFLTIASLETVGSWFEPAERVAASLRLNAGAVPPGVTSGLATTEPPLFPSLTVESWVRVSAPEAPSSDLELIGLALPDGTQPGWRLFVDAATGSPTFEIRGAEGSLSVAAPAGTFDAGIWTHIGAVFEPDFPGGPRLTLYVDGAVADRRQKAVGAYPLTGRSTVRFGPTADISLAEVRLWPKARTAEQIRTDMHRAIPVGSPEFGDLSGLWQFRDETVSDRTGIWSSSATTGDLSFETPAIETAADAVTEDSWHFVGRTALPPYSYFHRTKTVHSFPGGEIPGDETAVWTGWEPIGLTINSRFVSPLVVDGRLHLFWVEGRETAADASTKPEPTPARYFGVIKYARRNADGTWAPARSPFPDVPLPGKLEDETRPAWLKPYVLPVAFEGQSAILVIYGQEGSSEDAVVPPATFILKWDDTVVTSVVPSEETLSGRFYWAVGSTPGEESTATLDAVGLKSILAANGFEPNPSIPHLTDALVSITNGHTFAYPIDDLGTALPLSSDYEFRFGDSTAFHKGNELSYLAVQDGTQVSLYGSEDPLDDQSWELLAPSILAVEHWPATWLTSLIADSGSIYLSTFSVPPKGSFPAVVASSPLAEITKVPWSSVPAPLDLLPPKAFIYNGVATIVSAFFYAKPIMLMASCADPEDLEDTSFFPPGTVFVQLSQPVFWEKTNAWYVLTAAADRTRQLWKCAGLHQESWSPCAHSPSAAGSDSNAPQSGLTLIATKGGLVCDSGPLLSEWTNDPDGAPWMPISGIPELKPAFGMTYETEIAVEILGDARQDSLAIPVTNQLAGWTFRNGADGFLVRARRSAGHPLDAQVRAYMREQGVVQIEGTGAPDMSSARFGFERLTTSVGPALSEALAVGGIAGLMSAASQNTAESDFSTLGPREVVDLPVDPEKISFSLGDAFGCYFREIFFFLPWLIAERLNAGGQCEAARTFYEYIFKPSDAGGGGDYWRSAWLAGAFAETAVDELERPDPAALARYREDPFDSGAIADLRPVAYQRAIVTAYVRNMIDWGDDEFSLDTRESVNRAAQLYRFAGELLGPRPRHIEYTPPAPVSYAELELQALNEFLISDERPGTADAPEAPVPLPPGAEPNGGVAGLGFYFGLPDSREFLSNWDLVEDRLEKIRGGLDITGAVDDLPLFEPPLSLDDIQTLGQTGGATGSDQGGSAADAASEAESRFLSMIYSARSMAAGVAELGGSLLRALEMGDAEALVALQLSQQTVVAERVREIRVQEVNSALENAAAVRSALQAATFRRDFYSAMIEAGWSAGEGIGIALATESLVPRTMSGVENSIAAPLFLLPEIFGLADGGSSPGGAMQAEAASSGDMASVLSESSSLANLIASYERRSQEWEFQKGMAEFDVTQLERQASIAERQLRSAQMQFSLDETTMQQTRAVSGYYSSKFTSEELYTWMSGTLEQLHQQMFQIALGMAQMAESTLSAITGEDRQVISTGGWSSQRKGLLSGETMIVDLARLEQAYWQWQSNDAAQTTTKRISLRRIDPVALLQLATTGSCTFRLSEELFDRDRPGQYLRTIQDLSLNLSGVDAHRHEIFGTLTCLGHETVRQPDGDAVEFLLGDTGRLPGTVLRRDTRARRASLSHMESGEPNAFASGDLAAFRGIGAVSTWRLDLPPSQNRIDLRELEDVILNMTFTSRDGGAAFRERVGAAMPPHRGSLLVDVPPVTGTVTDRAAVVPDSLPRNLAGKQFELSSMSLISDQAHPPAAAGARVLVDRPGASTQSVVLEPVSSTHGNLFRARLDEAIPEMASQTWSLEIGDGDHGAATDRHWMLVEYEEKDRPTPEVRT